MKRVFKYALDHGYDVLVIQAGNDKDDPLEIPSLLGAAARTASPTSSRDRAISAAAVRQHAGAIACSARG